MECNPFGRFVWLLEMANHLLSSAGKLLKLIQQAWSKAGAARSSFGGIWEEVCALLRLLERYAKGEYTDIPYQKLILIVAALLYLVMPVDAIPDFIPGAGWLDDAAVLTWVITAVRDVINNFTRWEASHRTEYEPV